MFEIGTVYVEKELLQNYYPNSLDEGNKKSFSIYCKSDSTKLNSSLILRDDMNFIFPITSPVHVICMAGNSSQDSIAEYLKNEVYEELNLFVKINELQLQYYGKFFVICKTSEMPNLLLVNHLKTKLKYPKLESVALLISSDLLQIAVRERARKGLLF